MNADLIISLAPIGSIIEWTDGRQRPPDHHVATLYHWRRNNGSGLLVRKHGTSVGEHPAASPFFMLRCGDDLRTFSTGLGSSFRIVSRPTIGSVRIFERAGPDALMLHLAEDQEEARIWLAGHKGFSDAVAVEVTAVEVAADYIEGRVIA